MSVFDRAFSVVAETRDSGELLRYEPVPDMGPPWEAPAQWRVGSVTWQKLRDEAWRVNWLLVPSKATGSNLLGYPVTVDEDAAPELMVLEPIP